MYVNYSMLKVLFFFKIPNVPLLTGQKNCLVKAFLWEMTSLDDVPLHLNLIECYW